MFSAVEPRSGRLLTALLATVKVGAIVRIRLNTKTLKDFLKIFLFFNVLYFKVKFLVCGRLFLERNLYSAYNRRTFV